MFRDVLHNEFEEIDDVIKINLKIFSGLQDIEKQAYKKYIHKSMIIGIYTAWENLSKDIIYKTFDRNRLCFVNNTFMISFLEDIHSKQYVKKKFQDNFKNDVMVIDRDNLCYSNNLNSTELRQILRRVGFGVEDLSKHISVSKK